MHCAAYARFSSEKQSPLSIADQLRKCREFAGAQGWELAEEHCFSDAATSGAREDRAGLAALLAAARSGKGAGPPFGVVLVDDTSRLSRKGETQRICDELAFLGVRVVFVSQGIDSGSEQSDVLLMTHGLVDRLYLKELAKKTHRGLEGCVLRGRHAGGRCFGYRSVPVEDPARQDAYGRRLIVGARLEIDEAQAGIVRRIFAEYMEGYSLKRIAKRLNAEKVPPPNPSRPGSYASWDPGALSFILHNERYRGRLLWNKTRNVRDPRTGRRVQRQRPTSEWKIAERPELRIVSGQAWDAVQARLAKWAEVNGPSRGLCDRANTVKYVL